MRFLERHKERKEQRGERKEVEGNREGSAKWADKYLERPTGMTGSSSRL